LRCRASVLSLSRECQFENVVLPAETTMKEFLKIATISAIGVMVGGGAAGASVAFVVAAWAMLYCVGRDDFGYPCVSIVVGCPYVLIGAFLGGLLVIVPTTSRGAGALRGATCGAILGVLYSLLMCRGELWPLAIVAVSVNATLFAFVGVIGAALGKPRNEEDSQLTEGTPSVKEQPKQPEEGYIERTRRAWADSPKQRKRLGEDP
jgi:hypothetical protein